MPELHERLRERVTGWRESAYAHETYPAIAEILLHARLDEESPRYLREPQIRALETYWHLRLVEETPDIGELYERLLPGVSDRLAALGLADHKDVALDAGYNGLIERIRTCGSAPMPTATRRDSVPSTTRCTTTQSPMRRFIAGTSPSLSPRWIRGIATWKKERIVATTWLTSPRPIPGQT